MSKKGDAIKEGALAALKVAEAAGEATAKVATDPGARAGGALVAAVSRIIGAIIERHGETGAREARELLDRLHREGPQGISDADLAADDAALFEEVKGWRPSR